MLALLSPKQDTLVMFAEAKIGAWGCVILTAAVVTQFVLSVTVRVYTPAGTLKISSVLNPLDHAKLYGNAPPITVALAQPVLSPKQNTG